MYTLISGYGIAQADGFGWKDIDATDLQNVPVNQIFNLYRQLYLTLSAPVFVDPIYVNMEIFRTEYLNDTQTLTEMLDALSNDTLDTVDEITRYEVKQARYEDAFRAGYKIEVTGPASDPTSVYYPENKTELRLHRKNTNMQKFYDYCMVSVNGFWHRTDTDGNYAYVLDGGKSLNKSKINNIGLLSFDRIGKIQSVPITESMIYKLDDGDYLTRRAYFDLSSYDTQNKTVFAVIGGYMYLPSPAYVRQYSDNTWMIDFNNVPLLDRYFESLHYLDLSELGMTQFIHNPEQINKAEFFSDEHFTKYLTLKQSFFVIVDTPQLYTSKHFLRHNNYPGMFTTYSEPTFPLLTANGKVSEYWKTFEDGHWSVNVHDAWLFNRQAMSIRKSDIVSMTEANLPYQTHYNSNGYLLEIGADVALVP